MLSKALVAGLEKREALTDGCDAFTVVFGSKASVLEGEDAADANVKDITVDNFLSAHGKELLKNVSVKISHGKRNIDVLLVEQEVVGDDRSALEAVVSANEELVKLRQEVTSLQDAASLGEDNNEGGDVDDSGEKLAELYERLQIMGSDAAEAQASKILDGLGFTKDMQGRATRSFSVQSEIDSVRHRRFHKVFRILV
ncbi:hypothetical protein QQ045_016661 [Rhodiola kirilowii]